MTLQHLSLLIFALAFSTVRAYTPYSGKLIVPLLFMDAAPRMPQQIIDSFKLPKSSLTSPTSSSTSSTSSTSISSTSTSSTSTSSTSYSSSTETITTFLQTAPSISSSTGSSSTSWSKTSSSIISYSSYSPVSTSISTSRLNSRPLSSTSSSSYPYSTSISTPISNTLTASISITDDCDNSQCIENIVDDVRGAVISTVRNLIVIVESEHLELPPPCPNPDCGITLPDEGDFFEENSTCCD